MSPVGRRRIALAHIFASVVGGVYCTVWVAQSPYERVLMGISWYAIFITAVTYHQATDVRVEQDKASAGPD